jgi:hypothetical protein
MILGRTPLPEKIGLSGYVILCGDTDRGEYTHSVIAKDGEIVHDPHPSRDGIKSIGNWIVLVVLDPMKPIGRANLSASAPEVNYG